MSDGNGNGNGKDVPDVLAVRREIDPRLLDPFGTKGKPPVFPGYEGLPFRGAVPDLKESDKETRQPTIGYDTFVEILNLSKPEDLKRYEDIWQLISNSYALLSAEERQYDQDAKSWRVFIRWALVFTYVPEAK